MTESNIRPEKITKPIQLLGAWLAGLFSVNGSFLLAATQMPAESWEARALTVAAIANVPTFILALFILQTKFRPELQEDSYYSTYLSSKTNRIVALSKEESSTVITQRAVEIRQGSPPNVSSLSELRFGICKHLQDFDAVSKKLAEIGVQSYTTFGAEEPPKSRNVAISGDLPGETFSQVLSLARELGFTSFKYYDNHLEESDEDVLFGSYGESTYRIAGT